MAQQVAKLRADKQHAESELHRAAKDGAVARLQALLDGGANILVSLRKSKPGLYVGSQSGLEFVMKL